MNAIGGEGMNCGKVRDHLILATLVGLAGACNEGRDDSRASGAISATGVASDGGESDTDGESDTVESESDSDPSTGADTFDSDGKTGGSSGEDDSVDETSNGEQCEQAEFSFTFTPETPNVMLVLDKSRSMSNLWDHDLNPGTAEISRYNSLHNVVDFLVSEFSDDINFGAQLFPSAAAFLDEPTNDFSCLVVDPPEVSVGPNSAAQILAVMPPANDFAFSGGTPAVAGLVSAIDHLKSEAPTGNRAVIFITDGAANCSPDEAPDDTLFVYDEEVPNVIASAFNDDGIPVYVVGINILDEMGTKPAVNAFEAITDAAMVGGAPAPGPQPFYNAFNEIDLADAVEQVVSDIECTVNLDVEPIFPENVGVTVDLTPYGQVADCESGDGWTYPNDAGPFNSILLCGSACDSIQNGGLVEVEYLCPG